MYDHARLFARLVPERILRESRMPPLIARLGTRHVLGVATVALVIFFAAGWLTEPSCFGGRRAEPAVADRPGGTVGVAALASARWAP